MYFDDLQGSIVAIVTPYKKDGEIDYEKFEELVEWHILQGTQGLVVCGTTAETPALSETECDMLIRRAAIIVNGRIPVIAGSGSSSTEESICYSQFAENEGADALLVVSPYYNRPTLKGLYLHFSEIAEAVSIPIILYNVPARTGCTIPYHLAIDLAKKHRNIRGIKEAAGNYHAYTDLLANRPKGFKIFSGDDFLSIPANFMGADGCISVVANIIPNEFQEMMAASINNDTAKTRSLFFKYKKLIELMGLETNPIPVKTALAAMGKINEIFRLPLCEMNTENKNALLQELKTLELITNN